MLSLYLEKISLKNKIIIFRILKVVYILVAFLLIVKIN